MGHRISVIVPSTIPDPPYTPRSKSYDLVDGTMTENRGRPSEVQDFMKFSTSLGRPLLSVIVLSTKSMVLGYVWEGCQNFRHRPIDQLSLYPYP